MNRNRRSGFIEFFFLIFILVLVFVMYTATRTMDVAENKMRREEGLPEKEMLTDRLAPVKEPEEDKIKALEKKIEELEEVVSRLKENE
jgi:uncharacterized membrane protein